jgi:hypothetical protein
MAKENGLAKEKKSESNDPPMKKPYQEPAFRYERVFETMALMCGKIAPTTPHCRFIGLKSS